MYVLFKGLILLTGILFACQKEKQPNDKPETPEVRVLFEQPIVTNLENYVSKDPNMVAYQLEDRMLMTAYSLHRYTSGEHYFFPITAWDMGEFTGVASSLPFLHSQFSISTANGRKGATAFQAAGDAVGAINAPHLFPDIIEQMSGTLIFPVHPLHATFSQSKRIRPFADNRKSLNMSFEAKMPIANGYGTNGIGYLGPNFTLRDVVHGTVFYIGAQIWDSRGTAHEGLMVDDCDKCSGNVMVPTILSSSSRYITQMENSGSFRGNAWSDFQYFGWSITREDMTKIIKEIKENYPDRPLSDNLGNYEVVSFLLGTEIVLPTKSDKYVMATAIKNFKVTITP
ncbi:hypothetical protein C4F40_14080 [Sphingobacterium sp. Ka21]|uniref:Uncharacterized protein n=2 Tax=Sphingobacterium pedocola TaxID=2082722 RepID=A0ABR9TB15_9SPHI|nr:hypothetical protein [Sphingobacterium pedocola]